MLVIKFQENPSSEGKLCHAFGRAAEPEEGSSRWPQLCEST